MQFIKLSISEKDRETDLFFLIWGCHGDGLGQLWLFCCARAKLSDSIDE